MEMVSRSKGWPICHALRSSVGHRNRIATATRNPLAQFLCSDARQVAPAKEHSLRALCYSGRTAGYHFGLCADVCRGCDLETCQLSEVRSRPAAMRACRYVQVCEPSCLRVAIVLPSTPDVFYLAPATRTPTDDLAQPVRLAGASGGIDSTT